MSQFGKIGIKNLQCRVLKIILIGSLLLGGCKTVPSSSDISSAPINASNVEKEIFSRINSHRRSSGLDALTWNEATSHEARLHSQEMAMQGQIDHRDFDRRVDRTGIAYRAVGENVASYRGNQNAADHMVEGWLRSQPHRQNIDGDFSLTGIGVVQDREGRYFATQIFFKPR
jgi:uncharacterized protein YkwD